MAATQYYPSVQLTFIILINLVVASRIGISALMREFNRLTGKFCSDVTRCNCTVQTVFGLYKSVERPGGGGRTVRLNGELRQYFERRYSEFPVASD